MAKQIVLAETMGYCWGVRRTLDIIQQASGLDRPVATIGDVIHNPQTVERLRAGGVATAGSIDEAAMRGFERVAITAHGAGPERANEAKRRGLEMIDTTCPLVTKVQRLGQKLVREGYFLIVYGDAPHPEVRGILGWAGTSRAIATKHVHDLPWRAARGDDTFPDESQPPRKLAIISQTTKSVAEFMAFAQKVVALAAGKGGEVRICNTICQPTADRQNALHRLAEEVDAIMVVGGRKSSNTTRLAEVGRSYGIPSYHIERADEIDDDWLRDIERVGITAGASTPDDVIISVIDALQIRGYASPDVSVWAEALEPAY